MTAVLYPSLLTQAQTAYLMALSQLSGVGSRSILKLLDAMGNNPEAVWQANDSVLKIHLARKEKEHFLASREALSKSVDILTLPECYQALGIGVMSILDADYPTLLKETYDPPVVLYIRGNRGVLSHSNNIAVVGNRRASEYGRKVTRQLIGELAQLTRSEKEPVCIVSGLAEGIDGEAHRMALEVGLPTVAVFGCGIDIVFPKIHQGLADAIIAAGGACISEYPLGFPGSKHTFPQRNRIVAGLSSGVLVVEGSEKSGSLITARLAMEENRTVFAVPGNIDRSGAQGPIRLLRQGAVLVSQGSHVLEELGWMSDVIKVQQTQLNLEAPPLTAVAPDLSELSDDEQTLFLQLPGDSRQTVLMDDIQTQLGWPMEKIMETVSLMEISGWVVSQPGGLLARGLGI